MVTPITGFPIIGGRILMFLLVSTLLVGSGVATALSLPQPTGALDTVSLHYPVDISTGYIALTKQLATFQDRQAKLGHSVIGADVVSDELSTIQLDAATRQYKEARSRIRALSLKVVAWDSQLSRETVASGEASTSSVGLSVPILLYHYTPANFAAQLDHLKTHNYNIVDMDQVAAAMSGGTPLPDKPVVITFDDGFTNQLQAFDILRRYNMKATFYIITGGAASQWCIGAGRRYHDPLQPAGGCGDSYLTWDQVRMLDRSGLITIGAHTVDHQNLAADSPQQQLFEIDQSKAQLESQLGHVVKHFCYPYGTYNQTTIDIVRQAGFLTAVTTLPGTIQPPGSLFTLRRIRDTLSLP
jgi:peptidoglycan/xylan/chitin deacetylase (PgdA/CDA1 family)